MWVWKFSISFRVYKKKRNIKCIVKIAEPSQDNDLFSSKKLKAEVDKILKIFDKESIFCIQYLNRERLPFRPNFSIEDKNSEITNCLIKLKEAGKIQNIGYFSYFPTEDHLIKEFDFFINYFNYFEKKPKYKNSIAIRPFAGKINKDSDKVLTLMNDPNLSIFNDIHAKLLAFNLCNKNIISNIFGASNSEQIIRNFNTLDLIDKINNKSS